ncbi:hypothetical protein Q3A86_00075 [Streptomyces sp. NBUA17]|uniref:hypothetical protein n=1 Tax=Streptomyces sp. NBUA17 TaxID=3062275 RepID=UPI0037D9D71C
MDLTITGDPVLVHKDTQVQVGIHLKPGTLTVTRDGEDFAVYHALVQFASVDAAPWAAQEVKFSAAGADGQDTGFTVELFNDATAPGLMPQPRSGRSWPSQRPPRETSASPTRRPATHDDKAA